MIYKVIAYIDDSSTTYHIIEDSKGAQHRVDLQVDAVDPVMAHINSYYLIGKIVEIESLQPYICIGRRVSVVE